MEDDDTNGGGQARLEQRHAEVKRRAEDFVRKQLGEQSFYYRARGSLSALLTQPFLGACVLEDNFCALALNAPSDHGNCWAILPGGILVLSLDRETFQACIMKMFACAHTLGLPGEAVRMRPKGNTKRAGAGAGCIGGGAGVSGGGAGGGDRYVSVFDMSSKAFRPGKPLHDRLLSCLASIGFRPGGSEQQAGIGEPASVVPAVEVDMILCWWGADGKGGIRGVRSNVAGGVAGSSTGSRESHGNEGEGDGVTGEGQQQRQRKHGEEEEGVEFRCREVTFPQGLFSVTKKIMLEPDIRVFHEACCPDLDWVGQGFIPPPPPPRRPPGPRVRGSSLTQTDSFRSQLLPDRRPFTSSNTTTSTTPKAASTATTKCRLMLDLFEWLGAASCGLEPQLRRSPSPPEPYLSSFETPQHLQYRQPAAVAAASSRAVCRVRLRGLVPPPAVRRLAEAAGAVAAGDVAACRGDEGENEGRGHGNQPENKSKTTSSHSNRQHGAVIDGCAWASLTAWPFRDSPRAYAAADAPCGGGERGKKKSKRPSSDRSGGGRGGSYRGVSLRHAAREWPVGGHGMYTVVACPGETAAAFVSARCPGPGW
ncbi:unnamed protein product [Sphacelaria rigidula]